MKSILIISLLVVFSAAAWGGPIEYTVQYIPGLFEANGVNSAGQVAGSTSIQAAIGHPSGNTLIPLPPGWTSAVGHAINELGQVAGTGWNGPSFQPFIGDASGSTVIPLPAGWISASAEAINAFGQVAGTGGLASGTVRAFIGDPSGITAIPLPPGITRTYGFAVNASGQVAGWADDGTNTRPFIGDTTGSVLIPFPAEWTSAYPWAINDSGQVAMRGYHGTSWHIYIGDSSGGTLIPSLAGWVNVRLSRGSLNNFGVVVGTADDENGVIGGFIGDVVNGNRLLNDLVPPGWTIQYASSISDNGNILAYGTGPEGQGYLLLTPLAVPEPGTFALLGCGLAALAAARKRR